MPDIKKAFPRKDSKSEKKEGHGKRKSFEAKVKGGEGVKKRKLDQIEHVPALVSSTFNPLEEVDFPRGGSALTPLEKKQAEQEGIRDALFEVCVLIALV